jgi:hypothetical protein
LSPSAWSWAIPSRFRITLKTVRFRAALVQLYPDWSALRGLARGAGQTGFCLPHVTPIKADKLRRKTMTNIDFTLLIDALVRLVAALTAFVIALRRRRR